MDDVPAGPGDLRSAMIFVPHGAPEPEKWKAAHPGWVSFPAVMVLRHAPAAGSDPPDFQTDSPGRMPEAPEESLHWPGAPNEASDREAAIYDPTSPFFDAVQTLRKLGYWGDGPVQIAPAQWLEPLLKGPLSKEPEGFLPRFMRKIPNQSGKEVADDKPSWAEGKPRYVGESPENYATRLMDERWGKGQWKNIPERMKEFKRIKKYGSRAFEDPRMEYLFSPLDPKGGA